MCIYINKFLQLDDRLEIDEEIEILEKDGRTEEELLKATKEHEAKTKAIVLEMINDLPDAEIKPPDNVLFVCKLNPATQEKDLELIFSKFGTIRKYFLLGVFKIFFFTLVVKLFVIGKLASLYNTLLLNSKQIQLVKKPILKWKIL